MDEFVCLRMIQMNGVDLSQFQFDFDMSFGVVFMNPDGTIYGRYGTRNQRPENADSQISLEGLRAAMEAVLALHRKYPEKAEALAAKKGGPPRYPTPEQYPVLSQYTPKINYENNVAKSCIHCHQVHNAERQLLRDAGQPIPDEVLYLYPMPQVVGFELDPKQRATVRSVTPDSAAASAGLRSGDQLLSANGQPLVSIADFQWVLHNTPGAGGGIALEVIRAGKRGNLKMTLEPDWRKRTRFEWRVSTWDLRRMALGGMFLESDSAAPLGLRVKSAGKYGDHAVARRAGVLPGDQLVEINGLSTKSSEGKVIAHILGNTKKGDRIELTVQRRGKDIDISCQAQ